MSKFVGFNTAWFPDAEFAIALRDVPADNDLKQLLVAHIQARKQCVMSDAMFEHYEALLADLSGRVDVERTSSCFKVFQEIYDLSSPAITLSQANNDGVAKALARTEGLREIAETHDWNWSPISFEIEKANKILAADPDDWHARVHLGYAQTAIVDAMKQDFGVFAQQMFVLWVLLNAPVSNQFAA